jgi:hypothetical protein
MERKMKKSILAVTAFALFGISPVFCGETPRDTEGTPLITLGEKHDFKHLHVVCPPYQKMQIEQKGFDSAEIYIDCIDAESRVEFKNLDHGPEQKRNCKITMYMERSGSEMSNCVINLKD